VCSDIKASHALVQVDGTVRLSGFRHSLSMTLHGQRKKFVHDFPDFYIHSLNWASRELLEQVYNTIHRYTTLYTGIQHYTQVYNTIHRYTTLYTGLQNYKRSVSCVVAVFSNQLCGEIINCLRVLLVNMSQWYEPHNYTCTSLVIQRTDCFCPIVFV